MNEAYLRRILVDHASEKRGGSVSVTSFNDQQIAATSDLDILALDEALDRLAAMDAQQTQIKVWLYRQLART